MATLTIEQQADALERSEASGETKPKNRALILLPALVLVAAAAAAVIITLGRGKESTGDAQIEGHVANVAPRVAGQVARVLVRDNQRVEAGAVLFELDPR